MGIETALKKGIISKSAEETQTIATKLAAVLPHDSVLTLQGDLGAGKTTFVKGLALAWQIKENVTSPTFNLFNIYQGTRQLVHLDAYRLNSPEEAEALLLEEFLQSPFCLAIEWPEKLDSYWSQKAWPLHLKIENENEHFIQLA